MSLLPVTAAALLALTGPAAVSPAGALPALTTLLGPAAAPVDPPATGVSLQLVTAVGTGCPQGTLTARMAEDNSAIAMHFADYRAVFGLGARPTGFRSNCQVAVSVGLAAGYTFAIDRTDYSGDAHIEPGATGSVRSNFYWAGMSPSTYRLHPLPGPLDGAWHLSDEVAPDALVYQPCGGQRYTNTNSELRVAGGTSNGETTTSWISLSPTDGSAGIRYHLTWRECQP